MIQTFLSVTLSLILAWGCAHYAKQRGRNPTIWFITGALFGIFALIILFVIPARKMEGKTSKGGTTKEPTAPQPMLAIISPLHTEKLWYYLDEQKNQFGPMSFHALNKAWNEGSVRDRTFVWNEAMENWQHFKDVIKLQET
jgi:hypothetical protein